MNRPQLIQELTSFLQQGRRGEAQGEVSVLGIDRRV